MNLTGNKDKDILIADAIIKTVDGYDVDMLKTGLVELLTKYVIPVGKDEGGTKSYMPTVNDFADLLSHLKMEYNFPELDLFTIASGRIFIDIEGKKRELTTNQIKPVIPERQDFTGEGIKEDIKKAGNPSSPSQEKTGRFNNLELD